MLLDDVGVFVAMVLILLLAFLVVAVKVALFYTPVCTNNTFQPPLLFQQLLVNYLRFQNFQKHIIFNHFLILNCFYKNEVHKKMFL